MPDTALPDAPAAPGVAPIRLDIWSDVACPWCYIGKRNLEVGLARYAARSDALPVEIELHSYLLSPDTPVDVEGNEVEFLARHMGLPVEQVREMIERVRSVAAAAGLQYDFDALQHTNTAKAHQVLHLAKQAGRQWEVAERLFSAYFVEGRHIGHDTDLADLAAEAGLDRGDVLDALATGRFARDVEADIAQAGRYGIRGVPFFVVDATYGLSGAHPPEDFEQVLAQLTEERAAAPA